MFSKVRCYVVKDMEPCPYYIVPHFAKGLAPCLAKYGTYVVKDWLHVSLKYGTYVVKDMEPWLHTPYFVSLHSKVLM